MCKRSATIFAVALAVTIGTAANAASVTYWNLFNIEDETAQNAQFATYSSLTDMLTDSNRAGVFNPVGTSAFGARNIVGSGSDGLAYWNLFNIEDETAQNAQFATYSSLTDMLTDSNRAGVFNPVGTSAFGARNIVGSGSDGLAYWNLFNIEDETAQNAQFATYSSLTDMLTDSNRAGVFNPVGTSAFGARNIVGSGAFVVPAPIPAPATLWLLATALVGFGVMRRRRHQHEASTLARS